MRNTCGIHAEYMRDTCKIHAGHVSRGFGGIQARPQVGLEIRILRCISMYPICILGKCILPRDMYMYPSLRYIKINLGYIQDTMYLNPQIHGTQDTLTIHVGYIGIHVRDTYKDTYLEPYLRPSSTSGAAECWS